MDSDIKTISITVGGRVQNVGFRYHTQQAALSYGIHGFVQNLPNGDVYIEAQGEAFALDLFVNWCKKGPNWAKVLAFKVQDLPPAGFTQFEIKR